MTPVYVIIWNTEDESGVLPVSHATLEAAIQAAREWEAEMLATDTTDAPRTYSWEVTRTKPPLPHAEA